MAPRPLGTPQPSRPAAIPREWWEAFKAAARRPLWQRVCCAFTRTYKKAAPSEAR